MYYKINKNKSTINKIKDLIEQINKGPNILNVQTKAVIIDTLWDHINILIKLECMGRELLDLGRNVPADKSKG